MRTIMLPCHTRLRSHTSINCFHALAVQAAAAVSISRQSSLFVSKRAHAFSFMHHTRCSNQSYHGHSDAQQQEGNHNASMHRKSSLHRQYLMRDHDSEVSRQGSHARRHMRCDWASQTPNTARVDDDEQAAAHMDYKAAHRKQGNFSHNLLRYADEDAEVVSMTASARTPATMSTETGNTSHLDMEYDTEKTNNNKPFRHKGETTHTCKDDESSKRKYTHTTSSRHRYASPYCTSAHSMTHSLPAPLPARGSYDPAMVVRLDSSKGTVKLNAVQTDLLWRARQAEYHTLLHRIVACLHSHKTPLEKCYTLLALHENVVIPKRLRLRVDTYEDVFHVYYAVAAQGSRDMPHRFASDVNVVVNCHGLAKSTTTGNAVGAKKLCPPSSFGQMGNQPNDLRSQINCSRLSHTSGAAGVALDLNALAEREAELNSVTHSRNSTAALALPPEMRSSRAATQSILSPHGMESIWRSYRYMVDSGTDPSARVIQYVMSLLELCCQTLPANYTQTYNTPPPSSSSLSAKPSMPSISSSGAMAVVEARAHALAMDLDRFRLTPTEYTIHAYIGICDHAGAMHLAVARLTDYQTRHERQASAGMYTKVIAGLLRHGHKAEAMQMITTLNAVPLSVQLVNVILHAARHSQDGLSAFTFYRAVFNSPSRNRTSNSGRKALRRTTQRLTPTLHTFSTLVEVLCENEMTRPEKEEALHFVVREMQEFHVKGNGILLNKVLGMMLQIGCVDEARQLRQSMRRKDVTVFDEHESALQQTMRIGCGDNERAKLTV